MQMILNISDRAFEYASNLARLKNQSLDQIVEKALENKFEDETEMLQKSIAAGADDEVLTLAKYQMPKKQNNRLSFLLGKKGALTVKQQKELDEMLDFCRVADLRKAIAVAEALDRKLILSAAELP